VGFRVTRSLVLCVVFYELPAGDAKYTLPLVMQYLCLKCPKYEEFEDTKEVIRIRISKKNRKHNGQKKKYKKTNNDLQNTTHKTKDRVTRNPTKNRG
jgi:hypothetical protein